jgi:thiamine-phosphate pyrophosphorylase
LNEIVQAQAHGADHVGLGPIFETRTKVVNAPPLGLESFERIAKASPLPVVGIAGITLASINHVAKAGAHAAAVASDWLLAADDAGLVSRVKALQEAFWR